MKILRFLFNQSKGLIILASICGIINGITTTRLIGTIHSAIDMGLESQSGLAGQFMLLALIFFLSALGSHLPLLHLSEGAILQLRVQLVKNILNSRLRFLENIGTSRLYASLSYDINTIARGLAVIPAIVISVVVLMSCFVYLGNLSPVALAAMAGFLVTVLVFFRLIHGTATEQLSIARDLGDRMFDLFRTVTSGIKELKLHAKRRNSFLNKLLEPLADKYRRSRIAGLKRYEIANTILNVGFFLVIGGLIFVLPKYAAVDAQVLSGLALIFVFMLSPMTTLGNHARTLSQAGVSLRKIEKLGLSLVEHEAKENSGDAIQTFKPWETIRLNEVSHTYFSEKEDKPFTLGPMNLTINAGEIIFVIGGNGSGKSTLAKLIVGLYEAESGNITIDGEIINEGNIETYRQNFSTVFTDFHIFSEFLGLESDSPEELDKKADAYLETLDLNHKVRVENGELSTTNLSTGQRKRLALLISYLEDRPIYLFDEWACDQDPQFKKVFYTELLPELKARGKTVLVITHDDYYFEQSDRIVKLVDGRLDLQEKKQHEMVS